MEDTKSSDENDPFMINEAANLKVNVPLLRKAVEWVEEQAAKPATQRQWYQDEWVTDAEEIDRTCGTCYCVAGYIGQLLDKRYEKSSFVGVTHVSDFASEALGLIADMPGYGTYSVTLGLFDEANSAADVRRIAEKLAGEPL